MGNYQGALRFVSTGFGYSVCANRVLAVLIPDTAPSKRRLSQVRKINRYVDMTGGHGVRSLLLLDDGQVAGCAMSPKTMLARLSGPDTYGEDEMEEGC